MQRNLSRLSAYSYDLCVVGGGIYGACLAWDAALRGLSVALVEKGDFACATSANSLKTIHGGFRYLQHADFKRMRESVRERRNLMRIAPHLVHPLPVLIPTYRHWMQRKEVLSLALAVNDLVGFDRNRLPDPEKRIPRGRLISTRAALEYAPGIEERDLTGGMVFYDGQVYNSERLVMSFLRSAAEAGAEIANYVEAVGFLQQGDEVVGIEVRDTVTGDCFPIQARAVVNTCGPWINHMLSLACKHQSAPLLPFAKAINLVTRPLFYEYAVGVPGKAEYRDADAVINKGSRLFFVAPWRGRSLVGTAYLPYEGDPDGFSVSEGDVAGFLQEIGQALPDAALTMDDVCHVHGGLVPSSAGHAGSEGVQRAKHYKILDHGPNGMRGLISVMGVKYTTARDVAEKAVDRVYEMSGQTPPKSRTAFTPVYGGDIPEFDSFLAAETGKRHPEIKEDIIRRLVFNYGSSYSRVLDYRDLGAGLVDEWAVLKAEVRHGVREEMARKLADVVFRRTELGSAGHPGKEALQVCAEVMAAELGWSHEQTVREMREVEERFLPFGTRTPTIAKISAA